MILLALAVLAPAAGARASHATADPALAESIADRINAARAENGVRALRVSVKLITASEVHAEDMGQAGFFSHSSADGTSFRKRIRQYYARRAPKRYAVGENILWSARSLSAETALSMWMQSGPHRGNILSRRYRELGVAVLHVPSASGFFGGRNVTLVVVDFGVR